MHKYKIDQFVSYSKSRRRGQALLLSVLIMIFIVLLGTTFIAIVASNMSNTARTGAKDEARQAATAGVDFADIQLTGSNDGLDWRPDNVTPPPAYGDPGYNFYYSALDRAQGWTNNTIYNIYGDSTSPLNGPANFVKYPNPQRVASTDTTANFMIRVSQVRGGLTPDADNTDNTKTGDIRIESIGFAQDDPAAYYKVVAYKQGERSNPMTAAMRTVSNWDFNANSVVQGQVIDNSDPSQLELGNAKGLFKEGDIITVGGSNVGIAYSSKIQSVTYNNTNPVLAIDPALPAMVPNGTLVQRAAALGAPDSVEYNKGVPIGINYRLSSNVNPGNSDVNNQPGSILVNGGLTWFGQTYADNLISPAAATPDKPASYIKASGLFAPTPGVTTVPEIRVGAGVTTSATPTISARSDAGGFSSSNGLVDDGWNRIGGMSGNTRQVQDFTPPDITTGGNGLGRYRQLTRYSQPDTSQFGSATNVSSAYGYGEGIYINNPSDVERANNKPMTQDKLEILWYNTGSTNYERKGKPASPTSATNSLEEQHLRGWVSPDQFLPRGAGILLNNNNTITLTLDSRSDNIDPTNSPTAACVTSTDPNYPDCNKLSQGGVPSKSWSGVDGTLLGNGDLGGVYTRTVAWPDNGTIFAEGNIRIRGKAPNAPRNLTVVSMNNIYIDGSLGAGNNKVLLLAKRNVIANPTQMLATFDAQTRLSQDFTGSDLTSIDVYDAADLRKGDLIEVENGSPHDLQLRVSGTPTGNPTAGYSVPVLTFSTGTNYTAGTRVYLSTDPGLEIDHSKPYTAAIRLSRFSHAIQRRLHPEQLPKNTIQFRLAFRHSAEYRQALKVHTLKETTPTGPPPLPPPPPHLVSAELANKLVATSPESIIKSADKTLTVAYTEETPDKTDTDTFLSTLPTAPDDQTTAAAMTLDDLKKDMTDDAVNPAARKAPGWHYDVNIQHDYATNPWYFMASVGNRYNFAPTAPLPDLPHRQNIKEPKEYVLPMATSVWLLMNGLPTQLQDNHWNDSLDGGNGGYGVVNQFGFNPVYINSDGTDQLNGDDWYDHEDALTSDQYFYQPNTGTPADDEKPTTVDPSSNAYDTQKGYDNGTDTHYTLDSRIVKGFTANAGGNDLSIQLDDAEVVPGGYRVHHYFPAGEETRIPFYRLSNLKLQKETPVPSPEEINEVAPGAVMDINAFVYAQEGNWNVIPGDYFDEDVKNGQNLNRDDDDGVISQGEQAAAYRFRHYNYQIVFTGAIMENQTASMKHVGDWMDKWATINSPVPALATNFESADPSGAHLGSILYYYDPDVARGVLVTDDGFHLPAVPGLIYQG